MKYALGNIVTEVLEKECQKKELYRTFQIPTFSIIKSWIVLIIHNVSFSFLYIKKNDEHNRRVKLIHYMEYH